MMPALRPWIEEEAVAADAPSAEFLQVIPRDFAREHVIVSAGRFVRGEGVFERVLVSPTTPAAVVHNVGVRLGVAIEVVEDSPHRICLLIDRSYTHAAPDFPEAVVDRVGIDQLLAAADQDLLTTSGKGPIVRLVDALLLEALSRRASDLHIQPVGDALLVRHRVDGVLHTVRTLPPSVAAAVASRFKIMGRMDVAERRLAQDGRAAVVLGGSGLGQVNLRIATLPTSHGERVVVRLLETGSSAALNFDALGMDGRTRGIFQERAARPSGLTLLTGPTGSGKTTTLYTTLRWISALRHASSTSGCPVNIVTVEDPIEYELSIDGAAISQVQVNARKGMTFATGLRHILRQDPDVIMVGEIRDAETGRLALQASLTGHLVFSTLHTNDAPSAATRLLDLGLEPFLVASSLSCVVAQRLVRTLHGPCAGTGCDLCSQSGFLGRTGIFEIMPIEDGLRELISASAPASAIRDRARADGMSTLFEEGTRLARGGRTTMDEVRRVTVRAGDEESADARALLAVEEVAR